MDHSLWCCTTDQFERLLALVKADGYKLLGPTVRDEVVVYDELQSAQDLPIGRGDEQEAGRYRLTRRDDGAYFGYNLGPHSWKQYLFPSREKLWSARRCKGGKLTILDEVAPPPEKMAFLGVRACEIQAIKVLDKVFDNGLAAYEQYQRRRRNTLIIAVNCTTAARSCFCVSMQAGPAVSEGYDIALTEVIGGGRHYFVLAFGSAAGERLCRPLSLTPAGAADREAAEGLVQKAADMMVRKVDNAQVHQVLMQSWDSKQWDEVAQRCINCANCTMACPTCFCTDTVDVVSVDGAQVDRWRSWESCFNLSHSYIHGGSVRASAQSRYRQWLTHKFATWWDQFGVSGCVGCGRCIVWCPVGIDVTEELTKLQREYNEAHD